MKKPAALKPNDIYVNLSPNILEDHICTVVHAYFKGSRFHIIFQMFTGGDDDELYLWFNETETEKLMMKFQTHDPELFMYRLRQRFRNRDGDKVRREFVNFCDKKGIIYIETLR